MIYFLSIVFVFCTIVFVHEFGHYMAARSVGIRVEKFYLGFNFFGLGIKKKIGDTEYGIGAFPLGGYVKVSGIIDESMDSETTGADYEYLSKTPLQQIWFSSAGVIMNLLLSMQHKGKQVYNKYLSTHHRHLDRGIEYIPIPLNMTFSNIIKAVHALNFDRQALDP